MYSVKISFSSEVFVFFFSLNQNSIHKNIRLKEFLFFEVILIGVGYNVPLIF